MYPSQQQQPHGYPYQRLPPQHPPPPAVLSTLAQQTVYNMPPANEVPPSPRGESDNEDARVRALLLTPSPLPVCTLHNGVVWALDFVQQPVRARMCGFGDKDRRPISPPPCIRLILMDPVTKRELDTSQIDLSYFVLTVDLWDVSGQREVNLVRHAQSSPSISTASTGTYPPTIAHPATSHPVPQSYDVSNIPTHSQQNSHPSATNTSQYGYYNNSNGGGANGHMNGNINIGVNGHNPQMPQMQYSDGRYQNSQSSPNSNNYNTIPSFHNLPNSQESPYQTERRLPDRNGSIDIPSPQTAGMYTRNLIGSLSASAFPLKDINGQSGIWFIIQDLSVRTEGIFRIKATFVNIGQPSTNPASEGGFSANDYTQPQELIRGTAPVLATVFSAPFQVFSAKKFPGVIESTDLSKTFAKQGIKIPIRKDAADEKKGGGRRRGSDDVEEEDIYDED